jgi:hypothetical protein
VIIKFKRLECEVCKVNYPFKLAQDNKIIDIVDFDVPKSNYIVLESLQNEQQKVFYIINTEDMNKAGGLDRIKIGRSVDSDVRVTDDISVSRNHACIKKGSNGDYFLEDKKSKFGTLMLVQQPIFLSSK